LGDYGNLIRRQWWVVAAALLLGLLGGLWYTSTTPKTYTSTTEVLVTAAGVEDDAVSSASRTRTEINLDTEAQLVTSTAVVAQVADILGTDAPLGEVADRVAITVPPNTEVLSIAYRASSSAAAQDGAAAFPVAYLDNRTESATAQLQARQQARQAELTTLAESLQAVTTSLGKLPPGSGERAVAEAQVPLLSAQIATLTAEANELGSTAVTPGRVITDATLPPQPSSPVLLLNLAGGVMLGLLLGLAAALLRQRSDRRLRNADEVTRVTGLPVLVSIPQSRGAWLADATSEAGRGYVRLRNVLTADARPDARTILVAGINADGSEVADNLAAALARTGAEVVLVITHVGSATGQRLGLGTREAGLSDVLGGQATASAALQVTAGLETLRVLTPGQHPERAADLLETEAAANLLSDLQGSARYVILDAPPTATSAQAQSLAALCDTALVVIEAGTTGADDVNDAVVQLTAMQTSLVGSVLMPRRRRGRWGGPAKRQQSAKSTITVAPTRPTAPAPANPGEATPAARLPDERSPEGKDTNGHSVRRSAAHGPAAERGHVGDPVSRSSR
nr:hypothetical protein [Geodermatophilaceae bacterium]